MIWVYTIPAFDPDLRCHVYVGQSCDTRRRFRKHRRLHAKGAHPNIPASFTIVWEDVQVIGPFEGTSREVAEGPEQATWERWLARGFPMLNRVEPARVMTRAVVPRGIPPRKPRTRPIKGYPVSKRQQRHRAFVAVLAEGEAKRRRGEAEWQRASGWHVWGTGTVNDAPAVYSRAIK